MGRPLRVGLYSPYLGATVGGGEKYLGVVAEALRESFPDLSLDLIGSLPIDRGRYEAALHLDLSRINLRSTNQRATGLLSLANRLGWLRPMRNRLLSFQAGRHTGGYDLLLAMVYRIPVACNARRGLVLCQFPYVPSDPDHLRGYQGIVCQSEYVRGWVERLWNRPAVVLEPPVEVPDQPPDWNLKRNMILSVGRFFVGGHSKRQDAMVEQFQRLCDEGLTGWELHLAGTVHRDGPHAGYFESVESAAAGYPIILHPDAGYSDLRLLYSQASIYWHAAGYGADLDGNPDAAEHFGIATAEAMACGAVPIVFAAGGQVEVVPAGTGYLWTETDQLRTLTSLVIADPQQRRAVGEAARLSVVRYAIPTFKMRLAKLIGPILQELNLSDGEFE